jgi:hypothetical protein
MERLPREQGFQVRNRIQRKPLSGLARGRLTSLNPSVEGERVQFQQECKTDSDKNESPNQEGIDVDYTYSLEQESDPRNQK